MTREFTVVTQSVEETFEQARVISSDLQQGDVLGLTGSLGAGKTVFVKGIAKELGMEDPWETVTSPTYTLQNIYHLRETLYHCDAYRLDSSREFRNLGWHEQFETGITAIEWVDRFLPEIEPHLSLTVNIEMIRESSSRRITVRAYTDELKQHLKTIDFQPSPD